MHHKNEKAMQWDWQKLIKMSVPVVVLIFLLRALYAIVITNDEIRQMNNELQKQQSQFQSLHKEGDAEIKKVENGINNGAKEMEIKGQEFDDNMNNFYKDFHDSLEEEYARREKHRRERLTHDFVEDHVKFFDEKLYEADRIKDMKEWNFPLPNYQQYSEMREKAMYCQMKFHNQTEVSHYKNHIAQLKIEHAYRLIKEVPKPDIWQWPLTPEHRTDIEMGYYNLIFSILTPEGQCRND